MFEIHDDIEVLKRMGMACGLEVGKCSPEDLKVARSLVPKALEPYVIGGCHSLKHATASVLNQFTVPAVNWLDHDLQVKGACMDNHFLCGQ